MKINLNQPEYGWKRNYRKYQWNRKELLVEIGKAVGITILFSYFFYRSIWAFIPMSILGYLYFCKCRKEKIAKSKRQLVLQFKECILSVAASLRAGYCVENAFLESLPDMKRLYGEKASICQEIEWIQRGLVMNLTLEELLNDLGKRSETEEIAEFAEVFIIAKRSGGSILEIIDSSAKLIKQRVEVEEEIYMLVAARKLEQKIMNIMPFVILSYVGYTNQGYFDDLYHNFFGIIVMTICLAVYLTACYLSETILNSVCCV